MLASAGCGLVRNPPPAPEVPLAASAAPQPAPPPRHLACISHPSIDAWEHRLRADDALRAAMQQGLTRGHVYLPRVRRIVAREGLPNSLALLPLVESNFDRQAAGRFDDRGLWQLHKATARRFGLVVNGRRDQRLHPYRASRAAARYLRYLHRRYPDWALALAAYNAGEQRVNRALAQRPNSTFWELAEAGYLPDTSRDYVPRFFAVVRIVDGKQVCHQPSTTFRNAQATR